MKSSFDRLPFAFFRCMPGHTPMPAFIPVKVTYMWEVVGLALDVVLTILLLIAVIMVFKEKEPVRVTCNDGKQRIIKLNDK